MAERMTWVIDADQWGEESVEILGDTVTCISVDRKEQQTFETRYTRAEYLARIADARGEPYDEIRAVLGASGERPSRAP